MRAAVAFIVLASMVLLASAAAPTTPRRVIYERKATPSAWQIVGLPISTAPVRVTFALKQRNLDKLEAKFWAVSTPGSAEYRQFLSRDEIITMIAPHSHDRTTVIAFLQEHGVTDIIDRRDNLVAHTTAAVIEKMFDTKLYIFRHNESKKEIIRQMGAYSLPTEILALVDMVTGVSDFPMYKKMKFSAPNTDGYVVPQTLNTLYNVPATASAAGTSQGVIEFGAGQYYNPTGLQTFAKGVNLSIPALDPKHVVNPQPPVGVEGVLDIEYAAGLGIGSTNWYWTENDWLYDWASTFFAAADVPQVVSLSYGWAEYDQCDISDECSILGTDSEGFVLRVNTEFQKIGVRGISLLCASGDSGANGRTDPGCSDKVLHPDYPAASPYITAVGATQLNSEEFKLTNPPPICKTYQCASSGTETAVSYQISSFTSGGGFSNYAAQPSYQTSVVSAYLASGVVLPPASYFNASGRGYPDVAALGHNFLCYDSSEGGWFAVGGTSASSPSFAGIVSFLNAASLKKSGQPLGFLNPLLYKMAADHPAAFRDITVGDNTCTEDGCSSTCKGFRCAKGWDPVTGLGVPDVTEMLAYVSSL